MRPSDVIASIADNAIAVTPVEDPYGRRSGECVGRNADAELQDNVCRCNVANHDDAILRNRRGFITVAAREDNDIPRHRVHHRRGD